MISSLTLQTDKITAIKSGVNDFICKPFDTIELKSRCKAHVDMANLNKKYILVSKNQLTNLPNKSALFEDLPKYKNPKLLLSKIEDYELLEEFYSEEITKQIEIEFSKIMLSLFPKDLKITQAYHTNEGEFAFIYDDITDFLTDDTAFELFMIFQDNIKKHIIKLNGYEYDISVINSYSYGKHNIFEHARVGLNYAIKQDKDFIIANHIINNVKEDTKKNIKTINNFDDN